VGFSFEAKRELRSGARSANSYADTGGIGRTRDRSVIGAVRRTGRRRREAKAGVASLRSRLTALVVALSLLVQLVAIPYHQALAAPLFAESDTARIAADLKATFGDAAALCVQVDDKGTPIAPAGHCDDQCPLCRFAVQAVAFVPPDAPALPERLEKDAHAIRAPPGRDALPAYPAQPNSARAPPLAV
jgi:hypothetical protein